MSLKDQLLKAGLIDQKKAKQADKAKGKQVKLQQKNKVAAVDEAKLAAQRAQEEKVERDRQLNAQRKLEAEQKAVAAQIRQLIEMNRQSGEGDVAYNFSDGSKVKRIYVTEIQQRQLGKGHLAIVRLDEGYAIVPGIVAEKIAQRDASHIVVNNRGEAEVATVEEDDPYAEFQVPDDLMW